MSFLIESKIKEITNNIPKNVRLIAVSKTVSAQSIRDAYAAGIRHFAENRLQEAIAKQKELADLTDISWHFIGHIQSNKTKKVIQHFQWIHSVDSLKIAKRLNDLIKTEFTQGLITTLPRCFLQVKILSDPHKYGFEIEELMPNLAIINDLEYLKVSGLMSILPLGLSQEETLEAFKKVKDLATQIKEQNWSNLEMNELSMGMSGDYLLAIEAGATMIRLGTIIFGER